ncbi:MAG: GtrA family protein [Anaerolineae bacterium]|nr:GtrA family protein [Anaerolineae bacterium]
MGHLAVESSKSSSTAWVIHTPFDRYYRALSLRLGKDAARSREVERFLKFATVGAIGTVVDLLTLNLLQTTLFPPDNQVNVAVATTLAFFAAVVNNFVLNRYWTYPDSRSRPLRQQLAQFTLISVIGWIARTLWITLAYDGVGHATANILHILVDTFNPTEMEIDRLGSNVALMIAIVFVMLWNFVANRLWTYNDVK